MAEVAPLLQASSSASLGWWAVRRSSLRDSRPAEDLRQSYRFDAIRAAIHEQDLQRIIESLQRVGIQPMLAKGLLAAKLYPEPGLRPYDDIDLLVCPREVDATIDTLQGESAWGKVDLHIEFLDLQDRRLDDIRQHSRVMHLGQIEVRGLGPEDHLRLLCQHLLRHGAWRPVWLCDVAAALESLPSSFDWDYFLYGDERRTHWVRCTLALAQQLLNAEPQNLELPRDTPLPPWLLLTVLKEWGNPRVHRPPGPLSNIWRGPFSKLAVDELRCRWPNSVVATIFCGAAFDGKPRLPLQIANYALSATRAAIGKQPSAFLSRSAS